MTRRIAFLLLIIGTLGCGGRTEVADLILIGGTLVTLDDDRPEAQALAVRNGTILAVGTNDEIRALAGPSGQGAKPKLSLPSGPLGQESYPPG